MAIPGQDNPAAAAEFPCVRRLRHRRLLNFLRLEGLEAAFASMAGETDACFSVWHLRRMVERGQWDQGFHYLCRFLPLELVGRMGLEAQVLLRFLGVQSALANILAGTKAGAQLAVTYSMYGKHGGPVNQGVLRLRSTMLTVFHSKQQLRTSLDWERVRRKAAEIVDDLAHRIEELKGLVLQPMKPGNYPIRLGLRRGCHRKEQFCRPPASAIAKHYLQRKRSLLSSSHSHESRDVVELLKKAMNCVADLLDECLKAGKRPELHQEHPLKPSGRAGAFPPACPTTVSTFAGPGMLYVGNAMARSGKFASNAPTAAASSLGTVFGCLTNPDKGSGMSLMTDASTNTHWSQEGCNAESSQEGLNLQNDPRVLITYDEQARHPKRQRAAGTFGEASLMSGIQTSFGRRQHELERLVDRVD